MAAPMNEMVPDCRESMTEPMRRGQIGLQKMPGQIALQQEWDMIDRAGLAEWWQKEAVREFTKLECGLLGGFFALIAVALMVVVRIRLG